MWAGVSWGIFSQNAQATETQHLNSTLVPIDILPQLFEAQLFPKAGRGLTEATLEAGQLRPTPFGELLDVGLSDTPAKVLSCYKAILLAGGDIDFGRRSNQSTTLAAELAAAGLRVCPPYKPVRRLRLSWDEQGRLVLAARPAATAGL